jgi:DNA-binding MarR family transcriptional regulator
MKAQTMTCDLKRCRQIGETCVLFNLRKASRAITQLYEEIMKPSGLLPTQFTVLVAIRYRGPIVISGLAEVLAMDRTTLTRNLKPLEREGLVAVVSGRHDRRSREVSLSDKGLKQLEQALPLWQEAQNRIEQALGPPLFDQILDDMRVVTKAARVG